MRWLDHVVRMDKVLIPKQAVYWEVKDFNLVDQEQTGETDIH